MIVLLSVNLIFGSEIPHASPFSRMHMPFMITKSVSQRSDIQQNFTTFFVRQP